MGGTVTVNAVNGVATFSTLTMTKAGTGYTLNATAAGVTGATSTAFNIIPGPEAQLVFQTQPSNTVAGFNITPAVTVLVTMRMATWYPPRPMRSRWRSPRIRAAVRWAAR